MAKKRNVSDIFSFKFVEENVKDGELIQGVIDIYGDPSIKSLAYIGPHFEYVVNYTWNCKLKNKVATLTCRVKQGFNVITRHEYTEVYSK